MTREFIENIKTKLELNNLVLITEINENNSSKGSIEIKCRECNHQFEISISNLMDKRRVGKICPKCLSYEKFVNKLLNLYGRNPYIFKSEFISYSDPLTVECLDCHTEFTVEHARNLLLNSKLGDKQHPCKKCTTNRRLEKKDINELKNALIEKFGKCNYSFPNESEYAGLFSKKKFLIKCNFCGHEMNTFIQNILNPKNGKHYCRVCNKKDRLLENMSYKDRCLKTTDGMIEPLEEYIDAKTPIKHKCNVCGYGSDGSWLKIPVKNTKRNAGCPVCAGNITTSAAENEINNFIKSIYNGKIILKSRNILESKKELDIFLPELNIAFEINGLYWHSEKYKGKKYHIEKTEEAHSKGIRLVHIFEDEWYQKKDICKSKISNIIGLTINNRIYARKCEIITDIKPSEKNLFMDKYHIQGKDNASIILGLKYNDEIVAIMTFIKPRLSLGKKSGSSGEYELSRYATSCNVVGGFSKLLKYAIKTFNITCINTYADIRWSSLDNNVYTKNGFVQIGKSKPGYWYFNKNKPSMSVKRHHRFGFRKQELKKKFPDVFEESLTEFEIMDKTEYARIWDCGNLVYQLKL